MKDQYGREITYLRISVTDRCNLRCHYCMPAGGIRLLSHGDILSFEEIEEVAREAVSLGIWRVRLTGGEPLVRRDLCVLVGKLSAIAGIHDLAMTTNGLLLPAFAGQLARSGLQRVNISLDAVDPERFSRITRGGDVRQVLAGIDAARQAGLSPIKINCVVQESSREADAVEVAAYCRRNNLEVRFIRRMDPASGTFAVVEGGSGGDCPRCNRLRLSADGMVRPCLFSDVAFSVRSLGAAAALQKAIAAKPQSGGPVATNWIRAVGG